MGVIACLFSYEHVSSGCFNKFIWCYGILLYVSNIALFPCVIKLILSLARNELKLLILHTRKIKFLLTKVFDCCLLL